VNWKVAKIPVWAIV